VVYLKTMSVAQWVMSVQGIIKHGGVIEWGVIWFINPSFDRKNAENYYES
jgi:hypothetical protein